MERFEAEHGTLLTGAMFLGRELQTPYFGELQLLINLSLALSTLPAGSYLLIERGILRGNTAVMGARYSHREYQNLDTVSLAVQYLGVCTPGHRRHKDIQGQSILCVS